MTTLEILKRAKAAAPAVASLSDAEKSRALLCMADAIEAAGESILAANRLDLEDAAGRLSEVMTDRLRLTPARIKGMADGIREAAALPDPVGRVLQRSERPNGLVIEKVSVPLGVIGIIYESRPNVTSDAAALCFRSGNVCVLKSGREAYRSSAAITEVIREAVAPFGARDAVNILEDNSRAAAAEMMTATGLVDVLIPRGGAGLIRACVEQSKVPVIKTGPASATFLSRIPPISGWRST